MRCPHHKFTTFCRPATPIAQETGQSCSPCASQSDSYLSPKSDRLTNGKGCPTDRPTTAERDETLSEAIGQRNGGVVQSRAAAAAAAAAATAAQRRENLNDFFLCFGVVVFVIAAAPSASPCQFFRFRFDYSLLAGERRKSRRPL